MRNFKKDAAIDLILACQCLCETSVVLNVDLDCRKLASKFHEQIFYIYFLNKYINSKKSYF